MNYRLLFCLLLIVAMVGTVSADTLIVYTITTADGQLLRDSSATTWSNLRDGAGNLVNTGDVTSTIGLDAASTSNKYYDLYRGYLEFNTSPIIDDYTIDSAILGITGHGTTTTELGDMYIGLTGFTPATNGTAVVGDYQLYKNTLYSDAYIRDSSWSTSAYNNFTFNTIGKNNVSKTAFTNVMLRSKWDILNDTSGLTWGNMKTAHCIFQNVEHGTTGRPFLEIVYSLGVSAPVASFTCTKNFIRIPNSVTCTDSSTNTPTSWEWSWGDGTANSTLQSPSHQYLKRGKFDIYLTATNAGGSGSTGATSVKVVGYENYY